MYMIDKMPSSGIVFAECIEDGYYVEGKNWFDVQEKMEEHEKQINNMEE